MSDKPELTHDLLKMKNHGHFGQHISDAERIYFAESCIDNKVNVGTPGHVDHGSHKPLHLLLEPPTKPLNGISEFAPEDIEYEMDDWKAKPEPPHSFFSDGRNSAKKRDKAKAKAQKKARKLQRKK